MILSYLRKYYHANRQFCSAHHCHRGLERGHLQHHLHTQIHYAIMAAPRPPLLVGLAGCTCGGKTTLASEVTRLLESHGVNVLGNVNQDTYYKPVEQLQPITDSDMDSYQMWDVPDAVDWEALLSCVSNLIAGAKPSERGSVLLVDGNMITEEPSVAAKLDFSFFITLPLAECRRRREKRVYEPPDVEGYFDRYVWPAYLAHEARAKKLAQQQIDKMHLLSGELELSSMAHSMFITIMRHMHTDWVHVTLDPLDVRLHVDFVRSRRTGAVATFVGIPRDDLQSGCIDERSVIALEYEGYEPMAVVKLKETCQMARELYPDLIRLCVMHRVGRVPVGEPSVVIAASSAHRRAALDACSWMVDQLKVSVPIWKKEVYADGSSEWKQNHC